MHVVHALEWCEYIYSTTRSKSIQTESYGWLTIEISHGRICRTGVLKLHKSITILHKDLAHYSVAGKEGSDGLLVAIGR